MTDILIPHDVQGEFPESPTTEELQAHFDMPAPGVSLDPETRYSPRDREKMAYEIGDTVVGHEVYAFTVNKYGDEVYEDETPLGASNNPLHSYPVGHSMTRAGVTGSQNVGNGVIRNQSPAFFPASESMGRNPHW